MARARLTGWGRHPVIDGDIEQLRSIDELCQRVRSGRPLIARGNGRAYGDAGINAEGTVSMLHFDRLLGLEATRGVLVGEAGLLLDDLLGVFVPRGWFPPVSPGTRYVTLGGMVAADVHGKNHPIAGSFGSYVQWLDVIVANGDIVRCSRDSQAALFAATLGGMGLTGVILRCCIRLMRISSAYLNRSRIVTNNLVETLAAFQRTETASYRVAWIDCLQRGATLGRALVDVAEHADARELPPPSRDRPFQVRPHTALVLPFTPPFSPLNSLTVSAFNALYYGAGKRAATTKLLDYQQWFYPLDSIAHWNRLYGRHGFAQYQCVLPLANAEAGLGELLREIADSRCGSFLSVLKRLGPSTGALSFPTEGYTLALDFPWSQTVATLMLRLDEIVIKYGGHLYLAKDARVTRANFERMQPRVAEFRDARAASGAAAVFQSRLSERLGL